MSRIDGTVISRRTVTLACCLAAAGCSHQAASAPPSSPSPSTQAATRTPGAVRPPIPAGSQPPLALSSSPQPIAVASATVGPIAVRTAGPSPASSPSPAGRSSNDADAAKVPMLPPDAPPRIVAVQLSSTTVHSWDRLSGKVVTSSNVASVEVRIAAYGIGMDKVGVGRFAMSYQMPPIPSQFHGDYTLTIIARNTRGEETTRAVALAIR